MHPPVGMTGLGVQKRAFFFAQRCGSANRRPDAHGSGEAGARRPSKRSNQAGWSRNEAWLERLRLEIALTITRCSKAHWLGLTTPMDWRCRRLLLRTDSLRDSGHMFNKFVLMEIENLGDGWQAGGRLYVRCAKPRLKA